jgi:hypothetical protein
VIRRALDEGRIPLDGNCDRFLQFVLALYHLRRFINDRHDFSFLPYFFLSLLDAGKTQHEQRIILFTGLERPPRFPWQRSGVAPAQPGVLPASKINCRAMRNLCAPNNFRSPQR